MHQFSTRLTLSNQIFSLTFHTAHAVSIQNVIDQHISCLRTQNLGIITFKVCGGVTVGRPRRGIWIVHQRLSRRHDRWRHHWFHSRLHRWLHHWLHCRHQSRSRLGARMILLFAHRLGWLCFLHHLVRWTFTSAMIIWTVALIINHFCCRRFESFVNFRRFSLLSQLCPCRSWEKHKHSDKKENGLHGWSWSRLWATLFWFLANLQKLVGDLVSFQSSWHSKQSLMAGS